MSKFIKKMPNYPDSVFHSSLQTDIAIVVQYKTVDSLLCAAVGSRSAIVFCCTISEIRVSARRRVCFTNQWYTRLWGIFEQFTVLGINFWTLCMMATKYDDFENGLESDSLPDVRIPSLKLCLTPMRKTIMWMLPCDQRGTRHEWSQVIIWSLSRRVEEKIMLTLKGPRNVEVWVVRHANGWRS